MYPDRLTYVHYCLRAMYMYVHPAVAAAEEKEKRHRSLLQPVGTLVSHPYPCLACLGFFRLSPSKSTAPLHTQHLDVLGSYMAIFNTLLLNCFLLPLFNPPVRYLGLPSPFLLSRSHPSPTPRGKNRYIHTSIHPYMRATGPEVAICKLDSELSTCQFHRVLVLQC